MDAEGVRREGAGQALAELMDACRHPLRDAAGDPLPGALLLLTLCAREQGLDAHHPGWGELAAEFRLEAGAIDRVHGFVDRLLDPDSPAAVTFCLGVSCSLNGANELRDLVVAALERLGASRPRDEVYCLSQCDRGPSIKCDNDLYCGIENDVVEDRRDWRGDAGPVSISDTSRPIRD